jgi:predicted enzyme related to lactoylglutathione lyase
MTLQLTKDGMDLGIVTTNGDAMLEFYRDVIGFEFEATLDMAAVGITMHRVWAGKSLLKLVVPHKTPEHTAVAGGMQTSTGMRYFTLSVSNLDEILADVEKSGCKVVWPRRQIRPGVDVGMVEDPDGNWVEFIETS